MKRRKFRLASVLRLYELRKQHAEIELARASEELHKLDGQIAALIAEIAGVAASLSGPAAQHVSTASWMAAYGKTLQLDRQRQAACAQQARQAEVVAKLKAETRRWSVKEETLLSLRDRLDAADRVDAAKTEQVELDETVLRLWSETSDE